MLSCLGLPFFYITSSILTPVRKSRLPYSLDPTVVRLELEDPQYPSDFPSGTVMQRKAAAVSMSPPTLFSPPSGYRIQFQRTFLNVRFASVRYSQTPLFAWSSQPRGQPRSIDESHGGRHFWRRFRPSTNALLRGFLLPLTLPSNGSSPTATLSGPF